MMTARLMVMGLACAAGLAGTCRADKAAAPRQATVIEDVSSKGLERMDFRQVVNDAKGKVFPAVVYIKVRIETFEGGRKMTSEATGSGVIISPGGEVLTNWHVIDNAVEVRCLLSDGRAFDAKIVGSDKDTDVALLQLLVKDADKEKELPYATMGNSEKLTEGDFVMAMGAPWGLSRSVSIGIISATRRYLSTASEYALWLQTDASISPGNSGGPLVNTAGEVIGLNARGMSAGAGDMGFAIPAEALQVLVPRLRQFGKADWSWTGLTLQPLRDFNKNMYFEGTSGVIIADTEPSSPARLAGIQPGDRLMKVGEVSVAGITDEDLPGIRRLLALLAKEKAVKLTVVREGKTLTIEMTPSEKGKVKGDELDCPRWDLTVKTINRFDNPDLFALRESGVFIFGIKSPGNAGASGLQAEDIILKINNKDVKTLNDVKEIHKAAIENVAREHKVILNVLRNGQMRVIVLNFSRDYSRQ